VKERVTKPQRKKDMKSRDKEREREQKYTDHQWRRESLRDGWE